MGEEKIILGVAKAAVGAASGIATGLSGKVAPHLQGAGTGAINASSNFFNGFAKALKNHKGVAGAVSAGTAAVVGHGMVATAVVAAAPVVAATAVVGGVAFGAYKLFERIRD